VPKIGAPDRIAVVQTADALADHEVERHPDLQELFEPGAPPDLTVTTVVVRVSLEDIRDQFRQEHIDPEAGEPIVIPTSWYNDRPDNIVDLVIERQEFVDGAWDDSSPLDPIPGQYTIRPQLVAEDLDAALRDDVLGQLSVPQNQLDLIQPPFYSLKNVELNLPVLEDDQELDPDAVARNRRVAEIRERIDRWERDHERLLKKLEDLGGTRRERDAGGDDRGGGGSGTGGGTGKRAPPGRGGKRDAPGKGEGGGGFGQGDQGVGKRDKDDPRVGGRRISKPVEDRLNRDLDRLEDRIDVEFQNLRDLGVDVDGQGQAEVADVELMLDGDSIMAWGHDLYAEPGRTYRYRVAMKVYNPFFGRKRQLIEEQEHLAESFTIDSPASDWSDPVRINPSLRVYITRAAPPGARGAGNLGRATAEVYRFYDGRLWMEKFAVPAGGYIGAVKEMKVPGSDTETVEVDFRTDLFVLDIVADIDDSGGNRRGLETGPGAKVLLQDLRTGEVLELRDPLQEVMSPDRRELMDRLAQAGEGGGQPL
jgi:hypothetical protein